RRRVEGPSPLQPAGWLDDLRSVLTGRTAVQRLAAAAGGCPPAVTTVVAAVAHRTDPVDRWLDLLHAQARWNWHRQVERSTRGVRPNSRGRAHHYDGGCGWFGRSQRRGRGHHRVPARSGA